MFVTSSLNWNIMNSIFCISYGWLTLQMGKKTTSNLEVKKARVDWDINPTWTTTFCNLCVEQIQAGNRIKGAGFSTKCWFNLVTKFCNETGQNYDKDQLKSRWDVLKGDWRVWE